MKATEPSLRTSCSPNCSRIPLLTWDSTLKKQSYFTLYCRKIRASWLYDDTVTFIVLAKINICLLLAIEMIEVSCFLFLLHTFSLGLSPPPTSGCQWGSTALSRKPKHLFNGEVILEICRDFSNLSRQRGVAVLKWSRNGRAEVKSRSIQKEGLSYVPSPTLSHATLHLNAI
jgi:hypothetical protein